MCSQTGWNYSVMLELHGIIMRSRVIQIPAYQHLSGPDVGQSH